MISSPLEFQFTIEPGMSDTEIEQLWRDTQTAQWAMDRFLAGEFTEQEMTDLLSDCEIDLDATRETLESNATYLGLIAL
jgi:hypothetical protein